MRFLHYWLVESQRDPSNDPLILWFNGGPGCSSLFGLFAETGPYLLDKDGATLRSNPYAWNKFANVLYLESPAGVGFSFATAGDDGYHDDDMTGVANYEALKQFMTRHPRFRNHSVFVAGESYAGFFVPALAARIIGGHSVFPLSLAGIIVGNGNFDESQHDKSLFEYLYSHAMVDEDVWKSFVRCCNGDVDSCDIAKLTGSCAEIIPSVKKLVEEIWGKRKILNVFDVYRKCISPGGGVHSKLRHAPEHPLPSCEVNLTSYLNSPEVRTAIHVPSNVALWESCRKLQYARGHSVYGEAKKIITHNVRILLYYGDTDAVASFLNGQKFLAAMGLKQKGRRKPWTFAGELAGFAASYEKNVTFVTFRGVGHMVPLWAPAQAQYVVQRFIENLNI